MNKIYWIGDINKCDLCDQKITKFFVDGKTSHGPWGIMCLSCHFMDGFGLGLGRGQKYQLQKNNRYLKVEG